MTSDEHFDQIMADLRTRERKIDAQWNLLQRKIAVLQDSKFRLGRRPSTVPTPALVRQVGSPINRTAMTAKTAALLAVLLFVTAAVIGIGFAMGYQAVKFNLHKEATVPAAPSASSSAFLHSDSSLNLNSTGMTFVEGPGAPILTIHPDGTMTVPSNDAVWSGP